MPVDHTIFLQNLTYLRIQHGLTPKQMAKLLNISVRSMKRMERGELPLSVDADVLYSINDHFDVSPCEVLGKRLWEQKTP